jgi:hypothetical protein
MTTYSSFENDSVRVLEAKTLEISYGGNNLHLLLYVNLGSSGITAINSKPTINLIVTLYNGSSARIVTVQPSLLSSGPFSDNTPLTFYIDTLGVGTQEQKTIDQHNTYPLDTIQGHVYYRVPINTGESPVSTILKC